VLRFSLPQGWKPGPNISASAESVAVFYRYRRDVLGMDEAQARAEIEAVWRPKGVWVEFVERRGERT
jgi:hypothetical protein